MCRPLFISQHIMQQDEESWEAQRHTAWPNNPILFLLKSLFLPAALLGIWRGVTRKSSPMRIDIERQLLERSVCPCGTAEPDNASEGSVARADLFRRVSLLVQEELSWPNACFIPDDRLSLLMVPGLDGLDPVHCRYRIEDELGIRFSEDDMLLCRTMTLGEFIVFVSEHVEVGAKHP